LESVLTAIEGRKRAFARRPFFAFLSDESLGPAERLSFLPCMAHWVMSFADLNKYFLRDEQTTDEHQRMVNLYSREDADHWQLFLEDFEKLGCDRLYAGTNWLRFLWGEETRANRMLSYRLSHLIADAAPAVRLFIVEAVEEAANVFFPQTVRLAEQFRARTGVELRYLGHFHADLEANHTGAGDHDALARINLDAEAERRALAIVAEVFDLFDDWADEVLRFAETRLGRRTLRAAA
jgi:hypothetical protein